MRPDLLCALLATAFSTSLRQKPELSPATSLCQASMLGNGVCDWQCDSEEFSYDSGDCQDPGKDCVVECAPEMVGNGECERECNKEEFNFDGGDCLTCVDGFEKFGLDCLPPCTPSSLHNGICESYCNLLSYGYDGGDCLPVSPICLPSFIGDGKCQMACYQPEFDFDGGDCGGEGGCWEGRVGDGWCDEECNVAEFNFDAGDCLTCSPGFSKSGSSCLQTCEPSSIGNSICDQECNTPQAFFDGGDCLVCQPGFTKVGTHCEKDCQPDDIGDSACDPECNTAKFEFDGGDCEDCPAGFERIGVECVKFCQQSSLRNSVCDPECNTPLFDYDGGDCVVCPFGSERRDGECVEVCLRGFVGNGVCEKACNTEEYAFDGGDCVECGYGFMKTSSGCEKLCTPEDLGDSACDPECNTPDFSFDDGDCLACDEGFELIDGNCIAFCSPAWLGDGVCDQECKGVDLDGGDCLVCGSGFAKLLSHCIPLCLPSFLGNSNCDAACNTPFFSYDSFDCLLCPPHTILRDGHCVPACEDAQLGNGVCDEACDTEEWGFDGGDCGECGEGYERQAGKCRKVCWQLDIGDGACDPECNSPSFQNDGGDCLLCAPGFQADGSLCVPFCSLSLLGNSICDPICNTNEFAYDGGDCEECGYGMEKLAGECVKVCVAKDVGDLACDEECNTPENGFDGGDCVHCDPGYEKVGSSCLKFCHPSSISDSHCDPECNTPAFNYDGGDCIECAPGFLRSGLFCLQSCQASSLGNGVCDLECDREEYGYDGGDCVVCGEGLELQGGLCVKLCHWSDIGDGACDKECNTAEFSYDAGDCDRCEEGFELVGGNCVKFCQGTMIGDNHCDQECDNKENGLDGGDCLLCGEGMERKGTECVLACKGEDVGNGVCDEACNTPDHLFDSGDCLPCPPGSSLVSSRCIPSCTPSSLSNGACQSECNTAEFDFDAGDCEMCEEGYRLVGGVCEQFCEGQRIGDGVCDEVCNQADFFFDRGDCLICGHGFLKVSGLCEKICLLEDLGNGVCNPECNSEFFSYDGGDCVVCGLGWEKVGTGCQKVCDKERLGNGVCDPECNTAVFNFDAGDCDTCQPSLIGNSICNPQCNTLEFDFDLGDCLHCEYGFEKHGSTCIKVCLSEQIADGACNSECNSSEFDFDGGDCLVCEVGWERSGSTCVKFCEAFSLNNGICDQECNTPAYQYDQGDCLVCGEGYSKQGSTCVKFCSPSKLGDGTCQSECDSAEYGFDGGDCLECGDRFLKVGQECQRQCIPIDIGDGACDQECNKGEFAWDGGDCLICGEGFERQGEQCVKFCAAGMVGDGVCQEECNQGLFNYDAGDCLVCEAGFARSGLNCVKVCLIPSIGNGVCDEECNTSLTNFDSGDCLTCPPGFSKLNSVCVNQCTPAEIGDRVCQQECNTEEFQFDEGDCEVCNEGFVAVNGECQKVCVEEMIGDGHCDGECNRKEFEFDSGDCLVCPYGTQKQGGTCVEVCIPDLLGNSVCDPICNTPFFHFDSGDCLDCLPGSLATPTGCTKLCLPSDFGDGACDPECNTKEFNFDNGDCEVCAEGQELVDGQCMEFCGAGMVGDGHCNAVCNVAQYSFDDGDCLTCGRGYAKISSKCIKVCLLSSIGDGTCHPECNTPAFQFDGGDCLVCGPGYSKVGPVCVSDCQCPSETFTSPCDLTRLGDGICDQDCNRPEFGFDNGDCNKGCQKERVGNGVCDMECDKPEFGFDGGDCAVCGAGSEKVAGECRKICTAMLIGNTVCDPECSFSDNSFDGGDCPKLCDPSRIGDGTCDPECNLSELEWDKGDCLGCEDGFVKAAGRCVAWCEATNGETGACDPFCKVFEKGTCLQCVEKYRLREGHCTRLLWTSGESTLVEDGKASHACVVVGKQTAWKDVPGSQWVWDTDTNRLGTYKFGDYFVFEEWVQRHTGKVTLEVSVDDYYKLVFNGHVVAEKAGSYNANPISYDITPYVVLTATAGNPNVLEIHATNIEGPAGLAYKLTTHQRCIGGDDVSGVCVCRSGYALVDDQCAKTLWTSGTNTQVGTGTTTANSVIVAAQAAWQSIPGTSWIWDSNTLKLGTSTFSENIVLAEALKGKYAGVTITLSVDDYYKLIVNGKTVTEKSGVYNAAPISFDLTQYISLNATELSPNKIQILATNTVGAGGLSYKIVIHQHCLYGAEDPDGICQCKEGFALVEDLCTQTVWTSSTNTKIETPSSTYNSILTSVSPNWKEVPGAKWIWDTKFDKLGTSTFIERIQLPASLQSRVASVSLLIGVDDYYKIVVNNHTVVEKAGVYNGLPLTYDLTSYFAPQSSNVLQIFATNAVGWGGVAYKLSLTLSCDSSSSLQSGICVCNPGFAPSGSHCHPLSWSASCPHTKVEASVRPSVLVSQVPGATKVAGSGWIWDHESSKLGVITLKDSVPLPTWMKDKIKAAIIEVSSDENLHVTVNGQAVASADSLASIADVTKLLQFGEDKHTPIVNSIQIVAQNLAGTGGVSYRFAISLKCQDGAEEVLGECECKKGYSNFGGECIRLDWGASATAQVADGKASHTCVVVGKQTAWKDVPGSQWVWDTDTNRLGTYKFGDYFVFEEWVQRHTGKVTLEVSVDDYYKLVFNGHVVAEKAGSYTANPISYDITPYIVLTATTRNPNVLEIHATNIGGPAGLAYKLTVHPKCPAGASESDGNCVCPQDQVYVNDQCVQQTWLSSPHLSSTISIPPLPGWQSIPGATWIWVNSRNQLGTFPFTESISVPPSLKVAKLSLTISVDDFYSLTFNGKIVTEKGGSWNAPPAIYDLTPYLDTSGSNLLTISASNTIGAGGLAYKLVLTPICPVGANIGDYGCVCGAGMIAVEGECRKNQWGSQCGNTQVGASLRPTTVVPADGNWPVVDKSQWVWDAAPPLADTLSFQDSFNIPAILVRYIAAATIEVFASSFTEAQFNDNRIQAVGMERGIARFDVTSLVRSFDNTIRVEVKSAAGAQGVAYRLIISQKCGSGAEDAEGVCKCKEGFLKVGDACEEAVWRSGEETQVADWTRKMHSVAVVEKQTAWKDVPGSQWVWDTDTNRLGTYKFGDYFVFEEWVQRHTGKVTLEVSVDDYYKLVFNGHVVAEKAGSYNANPISYDITPYVVLTATAGNPNVLEIHATNIEGPAGLAYKLTTHQRCIGGDDVSGVCVCRSGYALVDDQCAKTLWTSGTNTQVGTGTTTANSVIVAAQAAWQSIPGTSWIWDSNTLKLGTSTFSENIVVAEALKGKYAGVTITLSVDDYYKLIVNGKTVTEKSGVYNAAPISFDLTQHISLTATDSNPNKVQILATNTVGAGGLSYKIVIHQHCLYGAEDPDGVCQCKEGFALVEDLCTQTVWTSGTNTKIETPSSTYNSILTSVSPNWKEVPGAKWIWDTKFDKLGTSAFVERIQLPASLQSRVASVSLLIGVDDYYKIVLNNHTVVEKAGVYNGLPLTYDLTSFFAPQSSNVLQIFATNAVGWGGVAYKLSLTLSCDSSFSLQSGICVCNPGYAPSGSRCHPLSWISGPTTVADISLRRSVIVPADPSWPSLPSTTHWIWDTVSSKTGKVSFYRDFTVSSALQTHYSSASLLILTDEPYQVLLNAVEIQGNISDLGGYIRSGGNNSLEIEARNSEGAGGLAYELWLHPVCEKEEVEVGGRCECRSGFLRVGTVCQQLLWSSGPSSLLSFSSTPPSPAALLSPDPSWRSIPGADWLWANDSHMLGTILFEQEFTILARLEKTVAEAVLTVAVDDHCRIEVNGHVLTLNAGTYNAEPLRFDLTPFIVFSDGKMGEITNKVKIWATNEAGIGGVAYKVELTLIP